MPRPEIGGFMYRSFRFPSAALLLALSYFLLVPPRLAAQDSKVMGELKFKGASGVEKDAGVWIDGTYVGYVKELKGDKKVLLLSSLDRKSTRLNSSHQSTSRMPS